MKKVFVMMGILLSLGLLCACSSDEEDIIDNGGIIMSFRLLNENGEETNSFKSGENIFFDMEIVNNCDTMMLFTAEYINERAAQFGIRENGADLLFPLSSIEDFFCVYSEDGKKIGIPYTGLYSDVPWMGIYSHSTYHVRCNWKETEEFATRDDVTYPLSKISAMPDLPVGNYYVSFTIKYRTMANDPESKFRIKNFNYQFTVL